MSVGTKSVTLSLEKHKELLWATNKKVLYAYLILIYHW